MLVRLSTFGKYAYFTDYERSSLTNSAIWFKAGEIIDGPAHSNNKAMDGADTNFHINYVNSNTPIFLDQLTAAGDEIIYEPDQPDTESEWNDIFLEGSRGFKLGVNEIDLPENTNKQKNAAHGGTSSFPTTTGVHVATNGSIPRGGIYIVGSPSIEFVDGGSLNQQVRITVNGSRYKITVNRQSGNMQMRVGDSDWTDSNGGGTVTSYSGVPNGVIYSTDHVTSLKGTFADSKMNGSNLESRNAWTVATDIAAEKNVTITNNLQFTTPPDKTQAWDSALNLRAPAFGVVAQNVKLHSTCPSNLTIHGVMLAGGRNTPEGIFHNEAWNWSTSDKATGVLSLVGGIIQKKRGPVGTFNASTGTQSSGYSKNYTYDRRMAVNPPPFFPTTGNYDRLSWSRTSAGNYTP
jgi:hypothetical protein